MGSTLELLPAVDVADGQAVRLVQGAAGTETSYGSPRDAALEEPAASLAEARAACGEDRASRGGARRRVRATGRVAEIRVAAATERPASEALLLVQDRSDPEGRPTLLRLVWQGQRSVPGVRADSAPVSAGTSVAASALMIDAR